MPLYSHDWTECGSSELNVCHLSIKSLKMSLDSFFLVLIDLTFLFQTSGKVLGLNISSTQV